MLRSGMNPSGEEFVHIGIIPKDESVASLQTLLDEKNIEHNIVLHLEPETYSEKENLRYLL